MAYDPYEPCPCGSGKKVKWCCQDILDDIDRAFEQDAEGQHEAAMRIMDDVVRRHPRNPEAWGRKAALLFLSDQLEEGEKVLEKAFEINPNYPWGLFMRAQLRLREGEVPGALLLARRAAGAFDPEAHAHLAQVYSLIARTEMARNHPVAAHAALRVLLRLAPGDAQLREAVESHFGPQSRLPECARKLYDLRRRPEGMAPERQRAWDEALGKVDSPHLGSLAAAFEQLVVQDAEDAVAWYNLAVARAWLGDNRKALEALDRYLEREEDEQRAAEAATLGEVLRCGAELVEECDYVEYRVNCQVRDLQALTSLLQEWHDSERMLVLHAEEQAPLVAMILEPVNATIVTTVTTTLTQERKLGGYLVLIGDMLSLSSPREEAFNRLRDELKTRTALGINERPVRKESTNFTDAVAEAVLFPIGSGPEESKKQRIIEYAQGYFEETWIHRPLRSLAGNTPLDASGHRTLRKKLLGVLRFLQDCAAIGIIKDYDFDRLRHKLSLGTAAVPTEGAAGDISTMSAAELAGLPVESLSDEQLEKAYQAAQKLDAGELSGHFARALVSRPFAEGRPADRYVWYSFLVQRALNEGDTDEALDYVNEGERADCEHNEGRRRNDYELRRAQVHIKRREPELAHDVFARLIERSPDNLKYRGTAAEGMLSLRQPEKALRFAEEGLELARQKNDRDFEQYLKELAEAARKQTAGG